MLPFNCKNTIFLFTFLMVLLVYFTIWLAYYAHIVSSFFLEEVTPSKTIVQLFYDVYFVFLPEGSLHVSEHGVVIRSNNLGTVEHGQRQTVPAPYQRTSDSQCGTDVLRRRATGECIYRITHLRRIVNDFELRFLRLGKQCEFSLQKKKNTLKRTKITVDILYGKKCIVWCRQNIIRVQL